nr:hypothetical protein B0A51_15862 [Rachicladosporium sp. CCFEE 5018]
MAVPPIGGPGSLSPLPLALHRGLTAVAFFGFLSFLASTALFLRLTYKLVLQHHKTHTRANQFLLLITNLIFADIQQSIAFLLNAQWLRSNAIDVGTPTCWAQGWFVSTGDLSSGLFTFAIAVHSYADIVHDFRLGYKTFLATIAGLWTFNYVLALVGPVMHPKDYYVRAGAWCWINLKYKDERLWLHYFWILIAEFGSVIIYTLIWLILRRRVKETFYTTSSTALRAKSAAKLIIAYPVVYVVCTLPLVTARLTTMAGGTVTYTTLCVAAAMITSNGWLDVLLYTLTRQGLIFGDDLPSENAGVIETFRIRPDDAFGTVTTIEAGGPANGGVRARRHGRLNSKGMLGSRSGSQENLFDAKGGLVGLQHGVKAETVVNVRSERAVGIPMGRLSGRGSDSEIGKEEGRRKVSEEI